LSGKPDRRVAKKKADVTKPANQNSASRQKEGVAALSGAPIETLEKWPNLSLRGPEVRKIRPLD